jgi:Bifunctional DNA primase/polymerase, N-terminal
VVERQLGPAFELNHGPSDNDSLPINSSQSPFSLRWALHYGSLGLKALPLRHGDKRPHRMLGSGWTRETVGSSDPQQIRRWWEQDMSANIGIVTGPRSGVLVIDLDMKIGKPRGIDSIFDLMDEYEPLPQTSWVLTPSLGQHLYFAWPEGEPPLPHVVGWLQGVDVPWQVAVPPSAKLYKLRKDSMGLEGEFYAPYTWKHVVEPLPLAPSWLLNDIRVRPRQPQRPMGAGGSGWHSTSDLPSTEWFLERGFRPGQRNHDCFRLALRLWNYHWPSDDLVTSIVHKVWLATDQSFDSFPWSEVVGCIKSAERYVGPEAQIHQQWIESLSRVGDWRGCPCGLRFQPPPVKPCMRFSRTRLTDIVHRLACTVTLRTFPDRRNTPSLVNQAPSWRLPHRRPGMPRLRLSKIASRSWT